MKINIYPNPWDLRYFQEIAFTKNLSRASERLGISQPALSLSLKRLEESLGVKLFYRRSRGLTLTAAGNRVLRESNLLLSNWESILSHAKKSDSELVGKFSVGCHPSVAIYSINDLIKDIYSNFQGIEVQLIHGLSRIICEQVISGEIDFGIVVNPTRHSDLVIHKLAIDDVGFWKNSKAPDEVLICNPNLFQTQHLLKKIKNKNIFKRMIESDNLEVITSMAKAGIGTAILPSRVVKAFPTDLIKNEKLPQCQDEITFIHRSDITKTAATKCLIEKIKTLQI